MAGKPPSWKCLKAEMQSRVRMVDYARGNGVSESSNPPSLCFTTVDYMKRWGFDALHFRNHKHSISASGLKIRTTRYMNSKNTDRHDRR